MKSHKINTITEVRVKNRFGQIIDGDTRHTGAVSDDLIFLDTLDKNGYIINNKVLPFRSFTTWWARLIFGIGLGLRSQQVTEYLSGSSTWTWSDLNGDFLDMNSSANDDTEGPVIGGNAAANTTSTATLGTRYTDSSGFDHSAVTHNAITSIVDGYKYEIDRTFTNSTGGDLTVEEIGLVTDTDANDPVLIARDAGLGISVNNTQALDTTHRFTVHELEGWNYNWISMIKGGMDEVNVDLKPVNYDTVLLTRSINPTYAVAWGCYGYNSDDHSGIIIGSSNDSLDVDDYCMQSHIEHGTSAGELYYGISDRDSTCTIDGNDVYMRFSRIFYNFSGGDVTVREYGLALNGETGGGDYDDPTYKIMVFRNLMTPVTVPDDGAMEVSITLKITVS